MANFWKGIGTALGAINPLIGAGTSIVGSLLGSGSQSGANRTNMNIAQLNNDFNERMMHDNQDWQESMMDKQNSWNLDMWNRNNAYNDPSAQALRWRDAGFNPYLMMSGASNTAQGITSAGVNGVSDAHGTPAHVDAYDPSSGFNTAASLVHDYFSNKAVKEAQTDNIIADTQAKSIDNETRNIRNMAVYKNLLKDIGVKDETIRRMGLESDFLDATFDSRYQRDLAETRMLQAQHQGQLILNDINKTQLKYLPATLQAQIDVETQRVLNMRAEEIHTYADVKRVVSETAKNVAEAAGYRLHNGVYAKYGHLIAKEEWSQSIWANKNASMLNRKLKYEGDDARVISEHPWVTRMLPALSAGFAGAAGSYFGARLGAPRISKMNPIGFR